MEANTTITITAHTGNEPFDGLSLTFSPPTVVCFPGYCIVAGPSPSDWLVVSAVELVLGCLVNAVVGEIDDGIDATVEYAGWFSIVDVKDVVGVFNGVDSIIFEVDIEDWEAVEAGRK